MRSGSGTAAVGGGKGAQPRNAREELARPSGGPAAGSPVNTSQHTTRAGRKK